MSRHSMRRRSPSVVKAYKEDNQMMVSIPLEEYNALQKQEDSMCSRGPRHS